MARLFFALFSEFSEPGGLSPRYPQRILQVMPHVFALLESWTCYGQWLPGDQRGYVANTLTHEGYREKRNQPGTPCERNDSATYRRAQELQKGETVRLSAEQAIVAATAMIEAAVDREWLILRGAIMANHVHILVANCPDDGPAVRRVLKGTSQAALSRSLGESRKWWTSGGSDRYKHGAAAVAAAVNYVANQEYPLVLIVENKLVLPSMGASPVAR